jgi:endonuclease/exonuclease/phosphatase family metal-dependent hydrolase
MPLYKDLSAATPEGKRIINRLQRLRRHLGHAIPQRTLQETLLLATWNIREFDSRAYGPRLPEAMHYIAEICAHFDVIAVQEVRKELDALKHIKYLLGPFWKYIVTDVTEGRRGNAERMAFVYDSRKVVFGGLAGELVIPPEVEETDAGERLYKPMTQLARTPFMVGFEAGWSRFVLATVHLLYGSSRVNDPERLAEVQMLVDFLKQRTEDPTAWARNLILLGDFNIFRPTNDAFKVITDAGFMVPQEIQELPSNAAQNKHYDQIAFRTQPGRLDFTGNAGVFNFFETVFTEDDIEIYKGDDYMGERFHTTTDGSPRQDPEGYYMTYWRTHQMSDHLPMWVELKIDYSDEYLARKKAGEA